MRRSCQPAGQDTSNDRVGSSIPFFSPGRAPVPSTKQTEGQRCWLARLTPAPASAYYGRSGFPRVPSGRKTPRQSAAHRSLPRLPPPHRPPHRRDRRDRLRPGRRTPRTTPRRSGRRSVRARSAGQRHVWRQPRLAGNSGPRPAPAATRLAASHPRFTLRACLTRATRRAECHRSPRSVRDPASRWPSAQTRP